MANLKSDLNSELYTTWEQVASSFWQEARQPESNENLINSNNKLDSILWKESQSFWEELASQRA